MAAVIQRPLRGSRISSFYPVKSLPSLSSLDSAFQLQEYISLLIRLDVHDVDAIVSLPGKNAGKERDSDSGSTDTSDDQKDGKGEDKDGEKGKGDVTVDEACWIYEQLRRLAQDLSHPLITTLQQECTRASCPEMKAGEWLYLCVAHGNDGAMEQCCAIDYILHTLDSATALLNSPRAFPSRLQIPPTSHRHFSSLARRLGRIFAHAYFHHREAFEQAEAESSLYARFLALTAKFDLVPAEFLVIPSSALGVGSDDEDERGGEVQPPRLLAAAVDPAAEREKDKERRETSERSRELHQQLSAGHPPTRTKSKSPPSLGLGIPGGTNGNGGESGTDSPRRVGRNRTDTMVFSEASVVVDELSRFGEEEAALKTARPELDGRMEMGLSPEDALGPESAIKGEGDDDDGDAEPISPTDAGARGTTSPPLEELVQPSSSVVEREPAVQPEQEEPPAATVQHEKVEQEKKEVEEQKEEEKDVAPPKEATEEVKEELPSETLSAPAPPPPTIEKEVEKANEAEVEHVEVSPPLDESEKDLSLSVETPAEPEAAPAPAPEVPAIEGEAEASSVDTPAPPATDDTPSTAAADAEVVASPPAPVEGAVPASDAELAETAPTPAAPVDEPATETPAPAVEADAEVEEIKTEPPTEVAAPEVDAPQEEKPAAPAGTINLETKSFADAAKATNEPKVEEPEKEKGESKQDETKVAEGEEA